ncbi:hypothetical protein [Polaribacter tangerinus]|uniref:hypothetical protein n=1 Tax=Polaribacter tangerinus TaxID=1920034 RepID=UPI000B4AA8E8|nr:hypothetical protein [Polaribacter tangerinus]
MKRTTLKLVAAFLFAVLTSCGGLDPVQSLPTVGTYSISNITFTSAVSGGIVLSDGADIITAQGICWSTSPNPTINDNVVAATTDTFVSDIIGLGQHGGTYYVRAFATNSSGTAYGNEVSFDTWNLDNTLWDFSLNYDPSNTNYPGQVDFYADGTARWEEPAYPGQFTSVGFWSVNENIVTYNLTGNSTATSYVFTGTVTNNNTMSGTFTWNTSSPKTFIATKVP